MATKAPKAPTKLHRPATMDHLRKKARPERVVDIHLDHDAVEALARLKMEKANIEVERQGQVTKRAPASLIKSIAEAQAKVDEATVEMRMRAIGSKAYDALLLAHPPTDAQVADAEAQGERAPNYNVDTFPTALVTASLVDPALTEAEVRELFDEWTSGEIAQLWMAALSVNTRSDGVSLGKASNGTSA